MALTIGINGLGLSHKGSNGFSIATLPDVCKTPTPGGPVPMPYPNSAFSRNLTKGTKTVKADGGNMAAIKGSHYSMSFGDEPGTVGGIKSNTFKKETDWITYSFDVKMDGKNACRLTDKKFHNHKNTVDLAGDVETPATPAPFVIQLDCSGYPSDEAPFFQMENSPERWTVRPHTRPPSNQRDLANAFSRRVDLHGLSSNQQSMISNAMGGAQVPSTGRGVIDAVSNANATVFRGMPPSYKINYHHLRPTWAGGLDAPSNLWPVRPGHQTAGIHTWWNRKLKDAMTPELQALGQQPPGRNVNTLSENNITRLANKAQNMDPPRELQVEMDCPEAVAS